MVSISVSCVTFKHLVKLSYHSKKTLSKTNVLTWQIGILLEFFVCHFFLVIIGLRVTTPTGDQTIRATLLLASADLPGKALMANMKQYNGEQGCSVCEDKGKTVGVGGLHRVWPYTTNMVLWTHKAVVESIHKVIQTGKPVCWLYHKEYSFTFRDSKLTVGSGHL